MRKTISTELPLVAIHGECPPIKYYLSELDGKLVCSCKKEFKPTPIPGRMVIVEENGKKLLRFDIALVLSEGDMNSDEIASACVSFAKHISPSIKAILEMEKTIPQQYHQKWWKDSK